MAAVRPVDANAPAIQNATLAALFGADQLDRGIAPFQSAPLTLSIDQMMTSWNVDMTVTGSALAAMIGALFRMAEHDLYKTGNLNGFVTFTTTPAVVAVQGGAQGVAAVVGSEEFERDIEDNDRGKFLRAVIDNLPAAVRWLQDLIATHQVKPLKQENITAYFKWKDQTDVSGRALLPFVKLVAAKYPHVMADEGARAVILTDAGDWITYHTAAASTGKLMVTVAEQLAGAFPRAISAATAQLIAEAADNNWDLEASRAIPPRAIALGYVWLEVTRQLPEEWYQGKKAIAIMNPVTRKRATALFKRYMEIQADTTTINNTTTVGNIRGLYDAHDDLVDM